MKEKYSLTLKQGLVGYSYVRIRVLYYKATNTYFGLRHERTKKVSFFSLLGVRLIWETTGINSSSVKMGNETRRIGMSWLEEK